MQIAPYNAMIPHFLKMNTNISDLNDKSITFTTDIQYCKVYHEDNESPTTLLLDYMNDNLQLYTLLYNKNKDSNLINAIKYHKMFAAYLQHPEYRHLSVKHNIFGKLAGF